MESDVQGAWTLKMVPCQYKGKKAAYSHMHLKLSQAPCVRRTHPFEEMGVMVFQCIFQYGPTNRLLFVDFQTGLQYAYKS